MLKKLFQRRKQRLRRRTSFLRMFAIGMILPVLITAFLGLYLYAFLMDDVHERGFTQANEFVNSYSHRMLNAKKRLPDAAHLAMFGGAGAMDERPAIILTTWVEPRTECAVFTFDENGNILNSNRMKMVIAIRMSAEPKSAEWFTYDPQEYDIPELKQLFDDAVQEHRDGIYSNFLHIDSLYLDTEAHKMVPHVISVTRYKADNGFMNYSEALAELEKVDEYQLSLDFEPGGDYVLTELPASGSSGVFPQGAIQGIFGCDPEFYDRVVGDAENREQLRKFFEQGSTGMLNYNEGRLVSGSASMLRIDPLYPETGAAGMFTFVEIDTNGLPVWRRLIFMLGLLFACMTLFVLAVCLIKNAKNKAQYAFEDYQRALTNNLAHDLKTPLAVIGGYAENLLQMRQDSTDEKELEYLRSIMNNVAYTDDIIRKTLQLSETEQIQKPKKTEIDLKQLAEQLTEKYSAALTERGISLTVSGSGTVTADADLLTAAAENLISNAVKYTCDGGSIRITADRKQFSVVNDTAENTDTKNLTMPFVKGDKARSDKRSSGLGLAIAKAAAERNGSELQIGCKDKKFTAVIHF